MKNYTLILFITLSGILNAQNNRAAFPQEKLNKATQQILAKNQNAQCKKLNPQTPATSSSKSALSMLNKMKEVKNLKTPDNVNWVQSHDTIFVGVVPHDTLIITGNWHHSGPILVL